MKGKNIVAAVLLGLVLAGVPLIVTAYYYEIGLKDFAWFADSEKAYDFFLYWKGQALILLCGLLALYAAVKTFTVKEHRHAARQRSYTALDAQWFNKRYIIALVAYFGTALLSTALSEHKDMAVWGGYEQWEGMVIIAAYVAVLFLAYFLVSGETEINIVVWILFVGVFLMSVLSVGQFFERDFFRGEAGQSAMNFMLDKKLNFTFAFDPGRVYATLYNPNYVGSYVALVMPVVLSLISVRKRGCFTVKNVLAALTAVFLVIMLAGSESVTGFLGVFASFILLAVFVVMHNKTHPKRIWIAAGVCVVALAAAVWFNRPVFEYGFNKIVNPTPNNFLIKSMEPEGEYLQIRTVEDHLLKLKIRVTDAGYQYEAVDGDGNKVQTYADGEANIIKFDDQRFSGIECEAKSVPADGLQNAVDVKTPSTGKNYIIVLGGEAVGDSTPEEQYRIYNPFHKVDGLKHIPNAGFEKNQHFGSRRGYLWSRTFPLLTKHILLGSGPNTFVYEFPNDDYVGMKNVGYDSNIVTKPHNMFMQIWVQTGLLSLIAFLALYVLYFVDSMKQYFRQTGYSRLEVVGIGILLGTFGYLVTGLANDSTVAVAPVYWCLLGTGMAVNRYNKAERVRALKQEKASVGNNAAKNSNARKNGNYRNRGNAPKGNKKHGR